jgi:hypothetical protein
MMGIHREGISNIAYGTEFAEGTARPPEIRRYRPDIDRLAWQRVLDVRDVQPNDYYWTVGFRHMKTYRAKSDGVNYLYASTLGHQADLWRTSTGEPNSWSNVWTNATVSSVRSMEVHNGLLYLALMNDALEHDHIGKIWATDGNAFSPVMEDGFGNPDNVGIESLISYNGWLYAGTANSATGYEIWKLAGPNENDPPVRVVAGGGPSPNNEWACSPCIFQGRLYYGSLLSMMDALLRGFPGGADIIRIDENDHWETVVGRGSLSGYSSGFNRRLNSYIWSMAAHDGWLYAGTFDQLSPFTWALEDPIGFIKTMMPQGKSANLIDSLGHSGADLYKTQDGVTWVPVTLDGFGDVGNYGFRTMKSVGKDFFVGTTNTFDGLEIWRATSTGGP